MPTTFAANALCSCGENVVATIHTLPGRELDTPDWLSFDECHLSKAKS
jgi:hypothetical protein